MEREGFECLHGKVVLQTLKDCSRLDGEQEFVTISSVGSKAYIAQSGSNDYGRYLTLVEYSGEGRRDIIIVCT